MLEIVSKGREFANQQMTRDSRKEKILSVCEELHTLVGERLAKMEAEASELKKTVKELSKKVKKLHRLLRKTIADQVSDLFINSLNPINSMLSFAERGKKQVHKSGFFYFSLVKAKSFTVKLLCVYFERLSTKYARAGKRRSVFLSQVFPR